MKKILRLALTAIIVLQFTQVLKAQTLNETIIFLNSKLDLYGLDDGVGKYNIKFKVENNKIIKTITVVYQGTTTSVAESNPKDALYVDYKYQKDSSPPGATINIMFKTNSVKWIDKGETSYRNKDVVILYDATVEEVEKVIKAYKHLIILLGGTIKDSPF